MTNDTIKQYCQFFETARLLFKTTKRLHVRHHVQNNDNITQKKILSITTTLQSGETMYNYILGIYGSSVQQHVYSIRM
jgi:hypothetical protein